MIPYNIFAIAAIIAAAAAAPAPRSGSPPPTTVDDGSDDDGATTHHGGSNIAKRALELCTQSLCMCGLAPKLNNLLCSNNGALAPTYKFCTTEQPTVWPQVLKYVNSDKKGICSDYANAWYPTH